MPKTAPVKLVDTLPGTLFRLWRDRSGKRGWTFEAGDSLRGRVASAHPVADACGRPVDLDEVWFARARLVVPVHTTPET